MKIIVFDLGGGTYDVSLIYVDKDKNFETMVYKGDEKLGGSDFDNKLIDYSLKEQEIRKTKEFFYKNMELY